MTIPIKVLHENGNSATATEVSKWNYVVICMRELHDFNLSIR